MDETRSFLKTGSGQAQDETLLVYSATAFSPFLCAGNEAAASYPHLTKIKQCEEVAGPGGSKKQEL
jgi:hypothetical protein